MGEKIKGLQVQLQRMEIEYQGKKGSFQLMLNSPRLQAAPKAKHPSKKTQAEDFLEHLSETEIQQLHSLAMERKLAQELQEAEKEEEMIPVPNGSRN